MKESAQMVTAPMKSKMPPKAAGRPDEFQTEDAAIRYLTPYIPKHWKIWETACGKGLMADAFRAEGYQVKGTDIHGGFDFLDPLLAPIIDYDMTVTNPPFSIKDKWIERCHDTGKPWALLMPITALGEQKRVAMYAEHGIQLVMPPRNRRGKVRAAQADGGEGAAVMTSHSNQIQTIREALEAADQCITDMIDVYKRDCSKLVFDEAVKSLRDDAGKRVKKALARWRKSREAGG